MSQMAGEPVESLQSPPLFKPTCGVVLLPDCRIVQLRLLQSCTSVPCILVSKPFIPLTSLTLLPVLIYLPVSGFVGVLLCLN